MAAQTQALNHVAIIMDGNGRWAKERGLPLIEGHKAGAEALENIINAAIAEGISILTIFGFSTENWTRNPKEIQGLMALLRRITLSKWNLWKKKDVRLQLIGRRDRFKASLMTALEHLENETRNCKTMTVVVALDYGARDELRRAVNTLIKTTKAGTPKQISESDITAALDTARIPDPDLLIRTGGEMRLSNFLLWQSSYSELYFTPKFWPDFTSEDLALAIAEFNRRERRFGGRFDSAQAAKI